MRRKATHFEIVKVNSDLSEGRRLALIKAKNMAAAVRQYEKMKGSKPDRIRVFGAVIEKQNRYGIDPNFGRNLLSGF